MCFSVPHCPMRVNVVLTTAAMIRKAQSSTRQIQYVRRRSIHDHLTSEPVSFQLIGEPAHSPPIYLYTKAVSTCEKPPKPSLASAFIDSESKSQSAIAPRCRRLTGRPYPSLTSTTASRRLFPAEAADEPPATPASGVIESLSPRAAAQTRRSPPPARSPATSAGGRDAQFTGVIHGPVPAAQAHADTPSQTQQFTVHSSQGPMPIAYRPDTQPVNRRSRGLAGGESAQPQ